MCMYAYIVLADSLDVMSPNMTDETVVYDMPIMRIQVYSGLWKLCTIQEMSGMVVEEMDPADASQIGETLILTVG